TNDNVEAVVLVLNSPGGSSFGVEELSDYLFANRAKLVAISSSMCASAAYWLGSSCSLFFTPGGDVGRVGVYSLHEDMSQALKDAGIKVTIAKAGKYKTELSPYEPLNQEAKDYMQEMVDQTYTKFAKAVARNRSVPLGRVQGPAFGEGRLLSANDALKNGLIDGVLSVRDLISRIQVNGVPGMKKRIAQPQKAVPYRPPDDVAQTMRRASHEQRKRKTESLRNLPRR